MLKHYLKLNLIVFLWGFTAVLGVLIELPAADVVLYRTGISALALGAILLGSTNKFNMPDRAYKKLMLVGAIVSVHWILFFASAQLSKISVCLTGIATCSLFTAFLEPLFHKKAIKWYEVALGGVVVVGLYIVFQAEYEYSFGLWIALASAFLAALFSVINSDFSKKYSPVRITFYEMLGATITSALLLPVYRWAFNIESGFGLPMLTDWGYLLILALVCTVYAFYECIKILQHLSAYMVNLTINLEPVYGILLAVIIFGEKEQMTGDFYWGAFTILLSVISYPFIKKWDEKRIAKKTVKQVA